MITIHCSRACAHLASPPELLTAGMAKAVTVELVFSDDWSGLTKTAVFSAGRTTVDVLESAWDGNKVVVPHEILADAGPIARVGVYGANADGLILPTVWVTLGKVMPAAEPSGDPGADPTLPIWAQLQNQIGDLDDLQTYNKGNLVDAINEARGSGGSGGGGYTIGDGLKLDAATNTLSVDTAAAVEKDNTKPVTSAAVYTEVGNINAMLATI
ncbi:MAG: hypothetical protein MSA04_09540 [Clostridiales bacterium]|nr:hypothetical protein [Clostridiales bacterium]